MFSGTTAEFQLSEPSFVSEGPHLKSAYHLLTYVVDWAAELE